MERGRCPVDGVIVLIRIMIVYPIFLTPTARLLTFYRFFLKNNTLKIKLAISKMVREILHIYFKM